jgi:hypothetical protein
MIIPHHKGLRSLSSEPGGTGNRPAAEPGLRGRGSAAQDLGS